MFGRFGRNRLGVAADDRSDYPAGVPGGRREPSRGPYDLADAPNDRVRRLDLGSLVVPVPAGVAVDLHADPASGRGVAVEVSAGRAAMTLAAYAAPKSQGLWEEARAELRAWPVERLAGLVRWSGPSTCGPSTCGPVEEIIGDCGAELRLTAEMPAGVGAAAGGEAWLVRVLGFDGPRWLLRAVVTVPAAASADADVLVDEVLRGVIVLRGGRAAPRGAALPLRRPTDRDGDPAIVAGAVRRSADAGPEDAPDGDGLDGELGRIRPSGAIVLDARGINREVIGAPVGGLSRNLTTWG
jgi:hypothetical protein